MLDRATREDMIANVINTRYSVNEQLALLRQRYIKPDEFEEFYDFAERTKSLISEEYEKYEAESDDLT